MPFPIDEKYILKTEDELGVRFPNTFRNKMIIENGGEIVVKNDVWTIFPFYDQSDRKRIKRTFNNIIRENKEAQGWHRFPSNTIAIANNGSGDFLVFFKQDKDKNVLGSGLYIWYHETGGLKQIADDFESIL